MRAVAYIVALFTAGVLMIGLSIPANAVGLNSQIKTNASAVKIADRSCGKWSPKMTKAKSDCRFKALKRNGFIALHDSGEGGPDYNSFSPHARPVADVYAV